MAERKPLREIESAPEKGVSPQALENITLPRPQETGFNAYFILIQRRRNKRRI